MSSEGWSFQKFINSILNDNSPPPIVGQIEAEKNNSNIGDINTPSVDHPQSKSKPNLRVDGRRFNANDFLDGDGNPLSEGEFKTVGGYVYLFTKSGRLEPQYPALTEADRRQADEDRTHKSDHGHPYVPPLSVEQESVVFRLINGFLEKRNTIIISEDDTKDGPIV